MNTQEIVTINGYGGSITIWNNETNTYIGTWAHSVMHLYNKALRESKIDHSSNALIEFINRVVVPKSDGLVFVWNVNL